MAVEHPESDGLAQIEAAWLAFSQNRIVEKQDASSALPADDVDLLVFAQTRIAGKAGATWPGRDPNLTQHFTNLLPEFSGQPYIVHLMACCIVVMRKTKNAGPGIHLFHRILREHTDIVFSALNCRWLTSVADTLADVGQSDAQRALGLCGSVLANTVKLAESERMIFAVPRPWPPQAKFEHGGPLFDGMIAYWTVKGDMIKNLLRRMENMREVDPVGGRLLHEIMERMYAHDTVFQRFAKIHKLPHPPLVSDDIRARLKRLSRKWL